MKKLFLILMMLVLVLPLNAYASESAVTELEAFYYSSPYPEYVPLEQMPALFSAASEYDVIVDSIRDFDTEITFTYNLPFSAEQLIIECYYENRTLLSNYCINAVFDNPDLLHVPTSFKMAGEYETISPKESVLRIIIYPRYLITREERQRTLNIADAIIADVIEPDMTEEEKALVLHDCIVDMARYNTEYLDKIDEYEKAQEEKPEEEREEYKMTDEDWENHTAYGVFANKNAVCQGYALAYGYLLDRVGIPNKFVDGIANGGGHGWNIIQINDNWYHVDTTWDDPTDTTVIDHKFFLMTDQELMDNGHSSWADVGIRCTDYKYSDNEYCFRGERGYNNKILKYKDGYFYDYKYINSNLKYVKSKFDGSDLQIITEDEYNRAFAEPYDFDINPFFVDENGVVIVPDIRNAESSVIYIKNENQVTYDADVYISYYKGGKYLTAKKLEWESSHQGYALDDCGADKIGVFVWKNGLLLPVAENIYIN